jgi:Zn-dependent protease
MNVFVDCPRSSPLEWRWRLLDVDVRVTVWFWISVAMLCRLQDTGGVLIWVAVCLFAVLLHEYAHVFALRAYGESGDIALYLWGGLTTPFHKVHGTPQVWIALAGPLAGFGAALVAIVIGIATGSALQVGWRVVVPVVGLAPQTDGPIRDQLTYLWYVLLNCMVTVNFYWALINLLPVFPFDGATLAQELLGIRRKALLVSAVCAALVAALGAMLRDVYLLLPFVVLAVSSAAAMENEPGSYKRSRG